jgi:RNA-directed DNA polymerase
VAGTSRPPPVKRGEIPPPGGGGRTPGVPTVLDRCSPQAGRPGLQPAGATPVSARRDGCRPGRSAPEAVAQAQRSRGAGDGGVVDLDFEKCCDRVNPDKVRRLATLGGADRRVGPRIDRDLKAGARTDAGLEATGAGTRPGGPVSPL